MMDRRVAVMVGSPTVMVVEAVLPLVGTTEEVVAAVTKLVEGFAKPAFSLI